MGFEWVLNGFLLRPLGRDLNGILESLEVVLHSCEERALGLLQLSSVHCVDVGGAAAAGQDDGCSSRLEAGEVLEAQAVGATLVDV